MIFMGYVSFREGNLPTIHFQVFLLLYFQGHTPLETNSQSPRKMVGKGDHPFLLRRPNLYVSEMLAVGRVGHFAPKEFYHLPVPVIFRGKLLPSRRVAINVYQGYTSNEQSKLESAVEATNN